MKYLKVLDAVRKYHCSASTLLKALRLKKIPGAIDDEHGVLIPDNLVVSRVDRGVWEFRESSDVPPTEPTKILPLVEGTPEEVVSVPKKVTHLTMLKMATAYVGDGGVLDSEVVMKAILKAVLHKMTPDELISIPKVRDALVFALIPELYKLTEKRVKDEGS